MARVYKNFFKRVLDIATSFIALILTFPLLLIVGCILLYLNKKSPFFIQVRPGKNAKLFRIIKFKTMTDETDSAGELLPEEFRITRVGKFIRKYSLDEIPQLINVFLGDMSLVGPRPLLPEYLPYYNEFQKRRHDVRPGITGWAQINGRNSISWEDKFIHDVWYVDHISFKTDCRILLGTLKKFFHTSDVSAKGHPTMPRFSDEVEDRKKIKT